MATATHHLPSCFTWIAVIALILSGCSSPQERYEQTLQQAVELRIQGDPTAALQRLERLAAQNPEDSRVLIEMGRAYADLGDATTAALFLADAAAHNPNDTELLIEAYHAQRAAGDGASATALVMQMKQAAPESLGPDEWLLVAAARADKNRARSALDAYLRAVRLNDGKADGETALEMGQLFLQVENYPQAERWLRLATADEITELPARFALMEVYFNQSAWGQAEQEIDALDERFPGAIEGSQWAESRAELERWKTARAEAARIAVEQIASIQLPSTEVAAATDTATASAAEDNAAMALEPPAMPAVDDNGTETTEDTESPAGTATALRTHPPSIKLTLAEAEDTPSEPSAVDPALTLDTTVAIEASEPLDGLTLSFDGAEPDSIIFESDPSAIPAASPLELSLSERAQQAAADGNATEAIRLYWRALGESPEDYTLWQRLSDAYQIEGQLRNAETIILEAIRLSPQSVGLTLQHLRIQQRLLDPQSFVRAVERAAERFPRSADVTLSLARAYERVLNDNVAAQRQYRRFIELDPDHPLRDEAEAALNRLF